MLRIQSQEINRVDAPENFPAEDARTGHTKDGPVVSVKTQQELETPVEIDAVSCLRKITHQQISVPAMPEIPDTHHQVAI
jgi:hypothetical protein